MATNRRYPVQQRPEDRPGQEQPGAPTAQAERRLLVGAAWATLDLIVDSGEGRPLDPGHFSHALGRIAARAGVSGVRLHDLRHAYATALLAAGVHPKIESEALGHASVGFTVDTYQPLMPSMQGPAARAIEAALGAVVVAQDS